VFVLNRVEKQHDYMSCFHDYKPLRSKKMSESLEAHHGSFHCLYFKNIFPLSSLLQGKHLPFSPSPLRLNIFRLFVILSLTQLYRYTPEIFLFATATFKYTYRAPLRRITYFLNETSACDFIPGLKTKTDFMWIFFYFCNV
jgi:hypothetical protein